MTDQLHTSDLACDLLIDTGMLYLGGDELPEPRQTILCSAERIVAVKPWDAVDPTLRATCQNIDLRHAFVMPGFVDAHLHLSRMGEHADQINCAHAASAEAIAQLVSEESNRRPKNQPNQTPQRRDWLIGFGWDETRWPAQHLPTKTILDERLPDQLVWLVRHDIHAGWCNSFTLKHAGIDRNTPDPPGGKIVRDAAGDPTGVLIDHAMKLVEGLIPEPSSSDIQRWFRSALSQCVRVGITSCLDALITARDWNALVQTSDDPWPVRVFGMADALDQPLLDQWVQTRADGTANGRIPINHLKLFADGALGSRGAALFEPYADAPGELGLLTVTQEQLLAAGRFCLKHGLSLCVHAIGDRAVSHVLDAFEQLAGEHALFGATGFRIEHVQTIRPADIARMKRLGVIASVQTSHFAMDDPWFVARFGTARADERAYRWQSLLKAGILLANGSDAPIAPLNPWYGIWSAVTRQSSASGTWVDWTPHERLSLTQALRSYTLDAANACRIGVAVGSITPGKLADLVAFEKNPYEIPASELLSLTPLMTIIGGNIVYQSN